MLSPKITHLLELIKASITCTNKSTLTEAINWPAIFHISKRQGVSALLLDAIEKLPSEQRPPKALLLQWIGHAAMIERMYAKHEQQITSLAQFLKQRNIPMLLLKGYGCSLCYPRPEHRPTGDIDIYLFGKQNEVDTFVEEELGINVHREYHKHSTFCYHGVEVENHAKFIDDVSHKSNIRFEQTLMQVLQKHECLSSPIDNVLLPSPTFNALFLLRHTGEHFASNEITLRHVLDVGTFFQMYHSDLDWSLVINVYKSECILDFFYGIATICVVYFGMDGTCFTSNDRQFTYKNDLQLANHILMDIFEEKKELPMSTASIDTIGKKLKYAAGKTFRWWHNRWKYQLVYNENLFESFWWLARNRMK